MSYSEIWNISKRNREEIERLKRSYQSFKVKLVPFEEYYRLFGDQYDPSASLVTKWCGCILTFKSVSETMLVTEEADTTFHIALVEKFIIPEFLDRELFEL